GSSGEDGSSEGSGESGAPDGDGCTASVDPPLRRLTAAEYAHSVSDLLGVDASDVVAAFPVDAAVDGFTNNAAAQAFLLTNARAYQDAAEEIAGRFVAGGEA